jgi:hypothetical protein
MLVYYKSSPIVIPDSRDLHPAKHESTRPQPEKHLRASDDVMVSILAPAIAAPSRWARSLIAPDSACILTGSRH